MKKFMKNNKKGFTLVELIVVLVILAILAALLIPALTGYIDKAKEKSLIAETRQYVMAAQTIIDEKSADTAAGVYYELDATNDQTAIQDLAEVDGSCTLVKNTTIKYELNGKIKSLIYQAEGGGDYCMYIAEPASGQNKYTVSHAEPTLP